MLVVYLCVSFRPQPRLRIAAIGFLNPAPLMWDFEHPPLQAPLAFRYQIDRMSPSECAARLASGTADIGLIPIAALATTPGLRILPGCTIASKGRVRSLLLVRRAAQRLHALRSVAADMASRTTLAHARILFRHWGNPDVPFLPAVADLDSMLERADAAILIGDPALLALEERCQPLRAHRRRTRLPRHGRGVARPHRPALRLRRLGRRAQIPRCPRSLALGDRGILESQHSGCPRFGVPTDGS